jgi:hypothetical protein
MSFSVLEGEDSDAVAERPKLTSSGLKKGVKVADKLVDLSLGISYFMDRYLKFKIGLEDVVAPCSVVYKDMQKANQLKIATFFMKSSFCPFAVHSTCDHLDIFQPGTPLLFQ